MSVRQPAYRDATPGLEARIAALRPQRETERAAVETLERLARRRRARLLGGFFAVVGVVVVVPLAALFFYSGEPVASQHGSPVIHVMLGVGSLALLVYGALRLVNPIGLGAGRAVELTGEPYQDLSRLEQPTPGGAALLAAVESLESWSVALPLMGLALALPLSMHYLFYRGVLDHRGHDFDVWMAISGVIVGHAHLVLVLLAGRFARRLKASRDPLSLAGQGWWALLWTTVAAAVPGIILYAIPVVLVAITGVVFIPLSFQVMARAVDRERRQIAACREALGLAAAA